MQCTKLGQPRLKVSGLYRDSEDFENSFSATQETNLRIVIQALNVGVKSIDSTNQYANGNSETIIEARREDHIKGIIDAWSADASADVIAEVRRITDDFAAKTPCNYPPPVVAPLLGGSGAAYRKY